MVTELEQAIIDRVRELRTERNISQAALAEHIGVSRGFIGDVENPRINSKYNVRHLNRIAIELNVSLWDIFPKDPLPEKGWK